MLHVINYINLCASALLLASKKLLLISQLDHEEELEQKNHIQALLIPALPLGLCLGALIRRRSMAVLLAFTASKYQRLFRLIQNNASWQNQFGCQSPASIYVKCRGGKHRPLRKLAGKGRQCFLVRELRLGLVDLIPSTGMHAQLCM